jgi:hypothetical protein
MESNHQSQKPILLISTLVVSAMAVVWIGYSQFIKASRSAYCYESETLMTTIAQGMDQYRSRHGCFPVFATFQSIVAPQSPLVQECFIPANLPITDRMKHPYVGFSSSEQYHLSFLGDPLHSDIYPSKTYDSK